MGDTSRDSTRMRGLYTFCFENPGSITYTIPSMVREVSAMFVDTTIFRPAGPPFGRAGGAASKIFLLHGGGQCGVQGDHLRFAHLISHILALPLDFLARVLDLLLSRKEQEHVARRLAHVDLHDGADGRF
mmetsp:Transcript_20057/g.43894  ORF Transcript_20057/g.43894 Transcript_20057/m.43894 type:complete len:130 (-) Transcript_20057:909-1298(-)